MNTLLVLFDMTTMTPENQQHIIDYLKKLGSWARLLPMAWLVKTYKNTGDVRNEIGTISVGGKVIVINVTSDGWATSFSDEVTNWMKSNL